MATRTIPATSCAGHPDAPERHGTWPAWQEVTTRQGAGTALAVIHKGLWGKRCPAVQAEERACQGGA